MLRKCGMSQLWDSETNNSHMFFFSRKRAFALRFHMKNHCLSTELLETRNSNQDYKMEKQIKQGCDCPRNGANTQRANYTESPSGFIELL